MKHSDWGWQKMACGGASFFAIYKAHLWKSLRKKGKLYIGIYSIFLHQKALLTPLAFSGFLLCSCSSPGFSERDCRCNVIVCRIALWYIERQPWWDSSGGFSVWKCLWLQKISASEHCAAPRCSLFGSTVHSISCAILVQQGILLLIHLLRLWMVHFCGHSFIIFPAGYCYLYN